MTARTQNTHLARHPGERALRTAPGVPRRSWRRRGAPGRSPPSRYSSGRRRECRGGPSGRGRGRSGGSQQSPAAPASMAAPSRQHGPLTPGTRDRKITPLETVSVHSQEDEGSETVPPLAGPTPPPGLREGEESDVLSESRERIKSTIALLSTPFISFTFPSFCSGKACRAGSSRQQAPAITTHPPQRDLPSAQRGARASHGK